MIQQTGHANVLLEALQHDSLSAFIAFVKMRLHSWFSLPHTQLVKVIHDPDLKITRPIVQNFENGYIVLEWQQIKVYRRFTTKLLYDPWARAFE